MKTIYKISLLILIFIFMIIILNKLGRNKEESFTPFINKRLRPLIRLTNKQISSYPFPNVNRYLKYWGLI